MSKLIWVEFIHEALRQQEWNFQDVLVTFIAMYEYIIQLAVNVHFNAGGTM
jgi:hypothetical protein